MAEHFRCEDGPDATTRVMIPCGDLDTNAVADLRRLVGRALSAGRTRLIVDLAEVTFMDTDAIAALLDASSRARRAGGVLRVVSPPDSRTALIFHITHADAVLRLAGTREEALRAA